MASSDVTHLLLRLDTAIVMISVRLLLLVLVQTRDTTTSLRL